MHSNLAPWSTSCPPSSAIAGGGSHIIVTSGDRFRNASEINDLFEQESPVGQLYVRLKELGILVEREWWIDEEGIAYIVNLALPVRNGWLPVTFGERPGPSGRLRFGAEDEPDVCLREIQAWLRTFKCS
jgi:hypothetical protein